MMEFKRVLFRSGRLKMGTGLKGIGQKKIPTLTEIRVFQRWKLAQTVKIYKIENKKLKEIEFEDHVRVYRNEEFS